MKMSPIQEQTMIEFMNRDRKQVQQMTIGELSEFISELYRLIINLGPIAIH